MTNTPTMITEPTIEEIGYDQEKGIFYARIEAKVSIHGALATIGTSFTFPMAELAKGASLARLMNLSMRLFLNSRQCAKIDATTKKQFKAAGVIAVKQLRGIVEPYFALQALKAFSDTQAESVE